MKVLFRSALLAMSVGLAGLPVSATTATPALCPQPIAVALFDLDAFYDFGGKGVDHDLIEELGRRTQCRFDMKLDSRVRIWTMLKNGSLPMSVSGIATPERRVFADFVLYRRTRYELVALGRRALPPSPEAFLADRSMVLGVVKSYSYGPDWGELVQSLRESGRLIEDADMGVLYRQLDAGRVQAILDLEQAYPIRSTRYGMRNGLTHARWFADRPGIELGLVLSKKMLSPELRQLIADNMEAMRRDGTLRKIFLRYMTEGEADAALLP